MYYVSIINDCNVALYIRRISRHITYNWKKYTIFALFHFFINYIYKKFIIKQYWNIIPTITWIKIFVNFILRYNNYQKIIKITQSFIQEIQYRIERIKFIR